MYHKSVLASLLLSFLGFLDATYLTILHYKHIIPPCTISGTNCEAVLTSSYATIFGIPIALLGSLFYLTVMAFLLLLWQSYSSSEGRSSTSDSSHSVRTIKLGLLLLSSTSLVVSAILVYIQAGILHAFCQYCLTSEAINALLFLITIKIFKST